LVKKKSKIFRKLKGGKMKKSELIAAVAEKSG